jgi:hypothetical protein
VVTNPPAIEEGLLPCPFCGCPNLEYDIISIECPNCFACGPPRRAIGDDGVLTSDGQWNKRKALSVTNPDVERLQTRVAELLKERLMFLATVYKEAPRFVAEICDTRLDKSGALLGEVRELARAALADRP